MKPIVVGLSNPHSDDPEWALWPQPEGSSGHRLLEIVREELPELTRHRYASALTRRNLLLHGEPEHRETLAHARGRLLGDLAHDGLLEEGSRVVLLGAVVRDAVARRRGWLRWWPVTVDELGGAEVRMIAVPHPSGLNRYYDRAEHRRRVAEVLAGLITER